MKLTQKRQNMISAFGNRKPIVNNRRLSKTTIIEAVRENFEFIASKLLSEPNKCGFRPLGYDGDTAFYYEVEETEEEFHNRVVNEKIALEKFESEFEEFKKQIYAEQQLEDELKAKKNQKYSDPEYLQYLKLKNKFGD